ncbi:hypothetical protein ACIP79_00820 [Streptomyces sp. NPDC088747]
MSEATPDELVAQLDEFDPIEHAFQALVILYPEHVAEAADQVVGGAS